MSGEKSATQIAPVESPQMVSTVKLLILKKGEYTFWSMRMEQYLTNINYSLWQVILNGDGLIQVTTNENGVKTELSTEIPGKKGYQVSEGGYSRVDFEGAILKGNVEHQEIKGTGMEMQGIGAGTTSEGLVESVRPSGVIIEDWVSDDEDIFQSNDLQATDKPSFKRIEFTNARNESVKPKQADKPRIITQNPKVDRRDWNGQMTQKLRLGFGFTKKAFLTRFGRVPVSAAKQSSLRATTSTSTFRPVNTATHTNRVNVSKLKTNAFHKSHSPIRRSFYKSTAPNTRISNEKINTVRVNGVNIVGQTTVSTVKGTGVTAVKASSGCVWRPKMTDLNNVSKDNSRSWVSKRVNYIDPQGRLKHMTRNKDFLTDYQDIDGGFVAFGGSARGEGEEGESSSTASARQTGHTLAYRVTMDLLIL
ncbi:hypothetical protein Tco_0157540 [Tanacetum coccineum]